MKCFFAFCVTLFYFCELSGGVEAATRKINFEATVTNVFYDREGYHRTDGQPSNFNFFGQKGSGTIEFNDEAGEAACLPHNGNPCGKLATRILGGSEELIVSFSFLGQNYTDQDDYYRNYKSRPYLTVYSYPGNPEYTDLRLDFEVAGEEFRYALRDNTTKIEMDELDGFSFIGDATNYGGNEAPYYFSIAVDAHNNTCCKTPAPIPLPGTLPLIMSGAGVFVFFRQRTKSNTHATLNV